MNKRQGRKARGKAEVARKVDYRNLRNPFPPLPAFPDDRIDAIHDAALDVLARLGIKVLLPEARALFEQAGANVLIGMSRSNSGRLSFSRVPDAPMPRIWNADGVLER